MDAKEFLKKCILICEAFENDGCVNCPLKRYSCGVPKGIEEQAQVIEIVEAFNAPPEPLICPRCKNEDHQDNARYCKICGLKIGEKTSGEV